MVFNIVNRKSCTDWKTFLNERKGKLLALYCIFSMTAVFSETVNIAHHDGSHVLDGRWTN